MGQAPSAPRTVLIAAPHTSNWDGILLIMLAMELRVELFWLGKRQLFPRPLGGLVRWLGGVPVTRSRATRLTEQVTAAFASRDGLHVVITPEGTRGRVEKWKTGFYRIAQTARVPVALGFLDFATRTGGIGPCFELAGLDEPLDSPLVEQDLEFMRRFYADKHGRFPEKFGPIRF